MTIIIWILQLAIVPVVSPLYVGIIRKIKAKLQNRVGASLFQPYKDLVKLLRKDEVISEDASWIFKFAPYLIFSVTVIVGAIIPLFNTVFSGNMLSDWLAVIYLLSLSTFFLALAGIDAGSPMGGFGSSREMTLAALAEGGLMFSILPAAFSVHSMNLFVIASASSSLPIFSFAISILPFVAFIIALLAETAHYPFDNPATHLELTMIHESMILEYSGKRLALIEWAAANKLLIFLALGANLFFPWGMATSWSVVDLLLALIVFLLKMLALSSFIAILESSMAKLRFFRLPDLLFASFILSIIAIGVIIIL
jgi:formate hydrogenlyase subunit 4